MHPMYPVLSGIEAISKGCPLLQTLSMNLMKDNLSDNAFVALVRGCKQLQRLEISGNKSITRTTYSLLLEPGNCPDLQYVIAHGCNGLTPEVNNPQQYNVSSMHPLIHLTITHRRIGSGES